MKLYVYFNPSQNLDYINENILYVFSDDRNYITKYKYLKNINTEEKKKKIIKKLKNKYELEIDNYNIIDDKMYEKLKNDDLVEKLSFKNFNIEKGNFFIK